MGLDAEQNEGLRVPSLARHRNVDPLTEQRITVTHHRGRDAGVRQDGLVDIVGSMR